MNLLLTVRLHDGRYHGMGEEEPSPGRLFQALVAGAAIRGGVDQVAQSALQWLESLAPPLVGLPRMWPGQRITAFVPNNDLDSVGGDPDRIADIRAGKEIAPRIFDAQVPFAFAWTSDDRPESADHAQVICRLAERLFQFGRGVDMAWSEGRVLDESALETFLASFPGRVFRPTPGTPGVTLACPECGTLASLEARFRAGSSRFRTDGAGNLARELFSQPPKARFAQVEYGAPPRHRVYELRDSAGVPRPWRLSGVVALVECVRDAAAERLRVALPVASTDIERVIVGRKADGADAAPTSARVRILPLPSIGHEHADRRIRRIVVEVPADCPLRGEDIHWAISGLELGAGNGSGTPSIVTPSTDESMFVRYGSGTTARIWRTVTPAVLPESAKRRRIEPSRMKEEAKSGSERMREHASAVAAIGQALRHAGVREHPISVRVQREPFEARGARAEAFAPGTRFSKERMWHVEIVFPTPLAGPLLLGDGRFLGLGVMAPVAAADGVFAFEVEAGLVADPDPVGLGRALRRAVMARVQAAMGSRERLAPYFSGHDRIGAPARSEVSPHLAFLFDPPRRRLFVLAPHMLERRAPERGEQRHLAELEAALVGFRELRAGSAGFLELCPVSIDPEGDPLFAPSMTWETLTDYEVTRHPKRVTASEALSMDIRAECRRRGLPEPRVTPRSPRGVPGQGLLGRASLTFSVAVPGPIVLGRSRHLGGGLFVGSRVHNDQIRTAEGAD